MQKVVVDRRHLSHPAYHDFSICWGSDDVSASSRLEFPSGELQQVLVKLIALEVAVWMYPVARDVEHRGFL
jgi:hypothetical protein